MKQIKTIEEIKALCSEGPQDFVILVGKGFRSSKQIQMLDGKFIVFNYIDDSEQEFTKEELNQTNISQAMKAGRFFHEGAA